MGWRTRAIAQYDWERLTRDWMMTSPPAEDSVSSVSSEGDCLCEGTDEQWIICEGHGKMPAQGGSDQNRSIHVRIPTGATRVIVRGWWRCSFVRFLLPALVVVVVLLVRFPTRDVVFPPAFC